MTAYPKIQPVLSGLCRGGPRDGQSYATQFGRKFDLEGGSYFHRSAEGATPAAWVWVEAKKDSK